MDAAKHESIRTVWKNKVQFIPTIMEGGGGKINPKNVGLQSFRHSVRRFASSLKSAAALRKWAVNQNTVQRSA